MSLGPILTLARKSLFNRRFTALLTVLAIALSVTLFIGVDKIRNGAREGFDRTISGTDLIVGARSGSINLLLYSVFRIGNATNNVSWESYERWAAHENVAWTIPISLGDSHRGYRVMGTTQAYFDHYLYGDKKPLELSQGKRFEDVFDAVLGADVARELGYELEREISVAHGIGATSFANHDDKPFTVVGILKKTGTPVDRTIHVSLKGIEAIHIGWESGTASPLARMVTADQVRDMPLKPKAITAFLVGLESRIAVLRLQRDINEYREEPLLAIIPGVALSQLWSVVGIAETALTAIAGFVVFTGLLGMLTTIMTSLNERRREMAILRSLGARPWHIFALLLSEGALLALIGSMVGVVLVYGGLAVAGPIIGAQSGIFLGALAPGFYDVAVIGVIVVASVVLGCIPAFRAYRNSLADGLTIRV